jgi:hypothetical protein
LESEDPKGIIVYQLSEYIEKLKLGFDQKIAFQELGLQAKKIVKFVFQPQLAKLQSLNSFKHMILQFMSEMRSNGVIEKE